MATPVDILNDAGPVAGLLGDAFEPRPEQVRMAQAVTDAMAQQSTLLVEAGTGVGKSFAYLVPAMMRVIQTGERVVVATNTIALQEQLIAKDIPMLQRALAHLEFPHKIAPVLVKGRGNYVSVRRLELASKRQSRLFSDAASLRSLHVIEDWAMTTTDGTLSSLPALERGSIWDRVQSDSGNCMGRSCPNNAQCFYQNARRKLEQSNLLICNHALFFSDLALRSRGVGFLPEHKHVILDEAHGIEDVACDHFGLSLTEGRVYHLLGNLYHHQTGKGFLPMLTLEDKDDSLVDRAHSLVLEADSAARAFFDGLVRLHDSGRLRSGRVDEPGEIDNPLSPAMRGLTVAIKLLREKAARTEDKFELAAYAERATAIADDAQMLIDQKIPGCVYWVELTGFDSPSRRASPRVRLACAPVDVAPVLKANLFDKEQSIVLTSATLATRTTGEDEHNEQQETAFSHVMSRLGCEGATTLQLGSPFAYSRQVEVFVDATVPDPRKSGDGPWLDALSDRILEHIDETDGGAFVLFTAFSALNKVADRLEAALALRSMPLLAQGRTGSRSVLLERFRADRRSVLFGAASFWQGVDVRGESLRNVIITKLPFEPPDRPLTQARLERIQERGGNPFMEDSLPRAIIRFKQGFGRLIRSSQDTGRVVVLDPRIATARYGRLFLSALPSGLEVHVMRPERPID